MDAHRVYRNVEGVGEIFIYALPHHELQREPHCHEQLEFCLVRSGQGQMLVGDRRYPVGAGSQLFLFQDQPHLLLDESASFEIWVLLFEPSWLEDLVGRGACSDLLARSYSGASVQFRGTEDAQYLDQVCEKLYHAESLRVFEAGMTYVLEHAWEGFIVSSGEQDHVRLDPVVQRALDMLREDPRESLKSLSQSLGLSASALSQNFQKQVGLGIREFRQKLYLQRFIKRWNGKSDQNLARLALDAGFGSYAQFYRVFKDQFGVAPSQYMK